MLFEEYLKNRSARISLKTRRWYQRNPKSRDRRNSKAREYRSHHRSEILQRQRASRLKKRLAVISDPAYIERKEEERRIKEANRPIKRKIELAKQRDYWQKNKDRFKDSIQKYVHMNREKINKRLREYYYRQKELKLGWKRLRRMHTESSCAEARCPQT